MVVEVMNYESYCQIYNIKKSCSNHTCVFFFGLLSQRRDIEAINDTGSSDAAEEEYGLVMRMITCSYCLHIVI